MVYGLNLGFRVFAFGGLWGSRLQGFCIWGFQVAVEFRIGNVVMLVPWFFESTWPVLPHVWVPYLQGHTLPFCYGTGFSTY